jgi:hypothetical protein
MKDKEDTEKEHESGKSKSGDLGTTLNSPLSTLNLDYDKVVFVPAEDIRVIERVLHNWDVLKQELNKLKITNTTY